MKYLSILFICILGIIQTSKASNASLFAYDESNVQTELSSVTLAENDVNSNLKSHVSIKRKFNLSNMNFSTSDSPNAGIEILSLAAGCCLGAGGAVAVSLNYYYNTGNVENGKTSLKYGLIGVGIRVGSVILVYALAYASILSQI